MQPIEKEEHDMDAEGGTPMGQQRRHRRTRIEEKQRNYRCSCGRSYLSYPALYTHIKTKHGGKAPGIIQMPRTEKGSKLKKYNFREEEDETQPDNCLKDMLDFLVGLGPDLGSYTNEQLWADFKTEDVQQLQEAMNEFTDVKVEYNLQDNGCYRITVDQVFARFMGRLVGRVNLEILREVLTLLIIWRNCLNQHYQTFDRQRYGCYCREATAGNILEIVNELVLFHVGQQQNSFQKIFKQGLMLKSERRPFYLTKFVYLFSRWLFSEKYTNSKLQINTTGQENQQP